MTRGHVWAGEEAPSTTQLAELRAQVGSPVRGSQEGLRAFPQGSAGLRPGCWHKSQGGVQCGCQAPGPASHEPLSASELWSHFWRWVPCTQGAPAKLKPAPSARGGSCSRGAHILSARVGVCNQSTRAGLLQPPAPWPPHSAGLDWALSEHMGLSVKLRKPFFRVFVCREVRCVRGRKWFGGGGGWL